MKRLVAFLSLAALCLLSTEALSQTTFTGALGQDWFEPGNWDNGIPAIGNDATIPEGLTVINDSSLWIGFVINNNGIIDNNGVIGDTILATGVIYNNGEFNNIGAFSALPLSNFETFNNFGTAQFMSINNNGYVSNYGTFSGSIANNDILDNFSYMGEADGGYLEGFSLTNNGILNNDGSISAQSITNHDTIVNHGALSTFGSLTNNAYMQNEGTLATFGGISNYGVCTNVGQLDIALFGKNYELIANDGIINVLNGALTNHGVVDNDGTIFLAENDSYGSLSNYGIVNNHDTISVYGRLDNGFPFYDLDAMEWVDVGGTINNDGTINNYGSFNFGIYNDDVLNNDGAVNNFGDVDNLGIINQCGTWTGNEPLTSPYTTKNCVDAVEETTSSFVMFPNPARNELTVKLQEFEQFHCIQIKDAAGRSVLKMDKAAIGNTITLGLSSLRPGVYSVQVSCGLARAVHQLIIER